MAETTFEGFWRARELAAQAYVRGDGQELDALVPHDGNASFHSPAGDTVVGAPCRVTLPERRQALPF